MCDLFESSDSDCDRFSLQQDAKLHDNGSKAAEVLFCFDFNADDRKHQLCLSLRFVSLRSFTQHDVFVNVLRAFDLTFTSSGV